MLYGLADKVVGFHQRIAPSVEAGLQAPFLQFHTGSGSQAARIAIGAVKRVV
jgi:hypothetical protein